MLKIFILLGIIVVSLSVFYYFVFRPIQQDKKLDNCLNSMWVLYGNNDELYKTKSESCFKQFR